MSVSAISSVPVISCILPVYNGEKYLAEAVTSILRQSFEDFELIIVNDGSTDSTARIIDRHAASDPRIVPLHQANAGIVGALNAGLALARGRYLARMDADDIALPHRFAFQAAYLDQHPECALVGGYAETFSDDNTEVGISTAGWRSHTDLSTFPPKIAVAVHPLIMMRTKTLREMGGYSAGYPHAEDYNLFIRVSRHGEIHNPPEIVLKYRAQPQSVSMRHTETQEWAALAAEFAAMGIALPYPPPEAVITRAVPGSSTPTKRLSAQTVHTYFWFRVWRRRRADKAAASAALRHMMPFLIGTTPDAWGPRYGLPLRMRIAGSIVLHSAPADAVRLWWRQRRVRKNGATATA